MHRVAVLLAVGSALMAVGCGGSRPAAAPAAAAAAADPPQVNAGLCQTSDSAGKPTMKSCTFVLNDGRRLGCSRSIVGPPTTVPQLLHDGCRWLTPLKLSRSMRAVIARIDSDRRCLTSKGLRVVGGPAFPSGPPDRTQPNGELVISSAHPTFIAFYTNAARAKRIEPALRRDDAHEQVRLERRGAVTIAWSETPTGELRSAVWDCVT
jgi:hypothetical protein